MPGLCTKCKDCAWENLLPDLEPCLGCFEDSEFEPKTTQDSQQVRKNDP